MLWPRKCRLLKDAGGVRYSNISLHSQFYCGEAGAGGVGRAQRLSIYVVCKTFGKHNLLFCSHWSLPLALGGFCTALETSHFRRVCLTQASTSTSKPYCISERQLATTTTELETPASKSLGIICTLEARWKRCKCMSRKRSNDKLTLIQSELLEQAIKYIIGIAVTRLSTDSLGWVTSKDYSSLLV